MARRKKEFDIEGALLSSETEEDVKASYVKWLDLPVSTRSKNDLLACGCLWEFKYNKNFKNLQQLSTILAQAVYYLRRHRYGESQEAIPSRVILADKNEAAIVESEALSKYFTLNINWMRAASSPDKQLISSVEEVAKTLTVYDMTNLEEREAFKLSLLANMSSEINLRKVVTISNFESAYLHWCSLIGQYFAEEDRGSCFMGDLYYVNSSYDSRSGRLRVIQNGKVYEAHVPSQNYDKFWGIWDRPPLMKDYMQMLSHVDRLKVMHLRRREGVFYTPLQVAKLALDYLAKELGNDWQDEYYIWDPACGTGNLVYYLKRYDKCFLSTIDQAEVDYIQENGLADGATVFQYDYLNDDIDKLAAEEDLLGPGWKLPEKLRTILKDCPEKLVILMNPPYAVSTGTMVVSESKAGVANTRAKLAFGNFGRAGAELYAQFLIRTEVHAPACVGVFSTLKLTNADDFLPIRDFFYFYLKDGFIIPASIFSGVKGKFPIAFQVYPSCRREPIERSVFTRALDVIQEDALGNLEVIGKKMVGPATRYLINGYCQRPRATELAVPLSSAINISLPKSVRCDTLAWGSLGYLLSNASDVQHSMQLVALLSSPICGGHGFSVTPDNFWEAMQIFAVRKVVKATWLNDRDQFTVPHTEVPEEFKKDCLVYTLFHGSNQTSALKDVEYKDKVWQIRNNFFPYHPETFLSRVQHPVFYRQLERADPMFVYQHLTNLSSEAEQVLRIAEQLYIRFFENLNLLDLAKWKIDYWDSGWYQIRNALVQAKLTDLKELKEAYSTLADKIRPKVYEYGFLIEDLKEI